MSVRDLTNQLEVEVALVAAITSDTTTFTTAIDVSNFNPGFMFSMLGFSFSDGTYVLTLQESPEGSIFTDIPTDKLIDPGGVGSITVDNQAVTNDLLGRIGAFSTDQFVRGKIVSTATTSGASVLVIVTKMPALVPVVT